MVDIYGRSLGKTKKTTDVDLTKYVTKEEVDNLYNLASVDPEEVAFFQDKQGKLKSTNLKWTDIVRRVLEAIPGNFAGFTDDGKIRDSGFNIKNINDGIEKDVSTAFSSALKTTGCTMTGELSLGGNKITVLRNPDSAEDAVNKQYVDAVDNKLSALKTEYEKHVETFKKFRSANIQKINKPSNEFFGDPPYVGKPLGEIVDDLNIVSSFVRSLSSKIPAELFLKILNTSP